MGTDGVLDTLLLEIAKNADCRLMSAQGQPQVGVGHILPPDLKEFYRLTGGCDLFVSRDYATHVSTPSELRLANPVIVGDLCEDDISSSWYIIAKQGDDGFMTIDLHPERLGRCYDSFWDRHGVAGSCAVIASSFTDLLAKLLSAEGRELFWLSSRFIPLGDAYDDGHSS